jgi:LAGLIDADG endonuclease
MFSDNPTGADNQQERPGSSGWMDRIPRDLGHWVAGFVDGEGSFNVPIRRAQDRGMPWRIGLSFNVSQVGRAAPALLRDVFGCGTVRGRTDGVFYYEVTTPALLDGVVFPFFERFPLRTPKVEDLATFRQITSLVRSGRHLTIVGFEEILTLRAPMNRGGKRRRCDGELIAVLRSWESSEAIRRAPSLKPTDEDMVQTA